MLIDQDIVPLHHVKAPSVLQPVYKQLLLHDIVGLAAGKELIIVIQHYEFNMSPETGPNQQTVILHMPIVVY